MTNGRTTASQTRDCNLLRCIIYLRSSIYYREYRQGLARTNGVSFLHARELY
jgi:hypothetical protein